MNFSFKVRGIEELQAFLKTLPYGGVRVALKAFTEYVLGSSSHGLRHDEPQRYISRKRAGYTTSQKQMAYFFAVGILQRVGGSIILNHYQRTGETAAAYNYIAVNDWNYKIVNPKIGAYYTRDDEGQTRQHQLAGRRNVIKVVMDNFNGAIRAAHAALREFIQSKGKS